METFVDFLQLLISFGKFYKFLETYGNLLQLMLTFSGSLNVSEFITSISMSVGIKVETCLESSYQ